MLSKKLTTTLIALSITMVGFADDQGKPAQISTVPSPAITTKALEVKITTSDLGGEVYCYTWCKSVNGAEKDPSWTWDGVNTAKFKMTGSGGTYSYKIDNIQEFYGLTDNELAGLTKLGFIAKNSGGKTLDLVVNVEQGRREVYGGGEGTLSSPYILNTAAHLAEFTTSTRDWDSDVYVKLGADIDGANISSSIGNASTPYQGHFDGNGHTISNVRLAAARRLGSPMGLFGVLRGGEITSLGVIKSEINGVNNAGILVGTAESGKIDRCFAQGAVVGNSVCIGGLVGENISATISNCYAAVTIHNIENNATGGVVGKNRGVISNVYATGEIYGDDFVGGIAGANYGTIRNSVALNSLVHGAHDYTARFGGNDNAQNQSVANHSWNNMSSIYNDNSWSQHGDHATTKPAYELADFNTFKSLSGWDFDNIWEWKRDGNYSYPALRNISNQSNPISESFFSQSGVEEILAADGVSITAGPTPFNECITVNCNENLQTVEVYSVNGVKIATVANPGTETSIDMSGAGAGIYIVSAISESGSKSTFKLIKK